MKRRIKRTTRIIKIFLLFTIIGFVILNLVSNNYLDAYETRTPYDIKSTNGNFIQTSHGNIYYEKATYKGLDTEKKSNVILLHGFGANSKSFRKNLEECSLISDCYAIDLKGYGLSKELLNTNLSNESQAQMVLEVADKLSIKEFSLIGNSMGGAISEILAIKTSERINGLILVSPINPNMGYLGISFPLMNYLVDPFYMLIASNDNMSSFLKSAFYNKDLIKDDVIRLYTDPYTIKGSYKTLRYIVSSVQKETYKTEDISVPTLIVHGENDSIVPLANSQELNKKIKLSTLTIIPQSGHVSMEESSEKFNTIMKEFLMKLK